MFNLFRCKNWDDLPKPHLDYYIFEKCGKYYVVHKSWAIDKLYGQDVYPRGIVTSTWPPQDATILARECMVPTIEEARDIIKRHKEHNKQATLVEIVTE